MIRVQWDKPKETGQSGEVLSWVFEASMLLTVNDNYFFLCYILSGLQSTFTDIISFFVFVFLVLNIIIRFDVHKSLYGRQVPPSFTGWVTCPRWQSLSPLFWVCSEPYLPCLAAKARAGLSLNQRCTRWCTLLQRQQALTEPRSGGWGAQRGFGCCCDFTIFKVGKIEVQREGQ